MNAGTTRTYPLDNSRRREAVDRIAAALASGESAPVILLSGEIGSGRRDVLEAAAARVGCEILPVDLEGFEPGEQGLSRFLDLWAEERGEGDQERFALARRLAGELPPTQASAALLSLALSWDGPTETLSDLDTFLARLSRMGRVVLHVEEGAGLNRILRRRLLEAAGRHRHLVLALSCHPRDRDADLAESSLVLRVELEPLTGDELVRRLDGGALESMRQDLLPELDLQLADRLERFLDLAALCGGNFPAELLLAHIELEEEARDEIFDLIDEELVEQEEWQLLHDLQYGHPSFPGLLTYAFVSRLDLRGLLESVAPDKRQRMALELLEFFQRNIAVATRGLALLFLSLADHGEDPEAREPYRRELAWWIAPEEAEELAAYLEKDLAAGTLTAAEILRALEASGGRWPPHRRAALLEAVERRPAGLPAEAMPEVRFQHAVALHESGRAAEALAAGQSALAAAVATFGEDNPGVPQVLNFLGAASLSLGRPADARGFLERALEIDRRLSGDGTTATAAILSNLGVLLRELGEMEKARQVLEESVQVHRRVLGTDHPWLISVQGVLGTVRWNLGDREGARQALEEAVGVARRSLGPQHPETAASLANLAEVLTRLGEPEAARARLAEALAIHEAALGEDHPATAQLRERLAAL